MIDAFKVRAPSLGRFWTLSNIVPSMSLTRALQYELLFDLKFDGRLLDFGGGDLANYREKLDVTQYSSVNIDAGIKPTWVIGVDDDLPIGDGKYDHVLAMNTLEHIFDAEKVILRLHGALKDGGEFFATTPFLYPIHAHPDDFFRPTPSWYRHALSRAGFEDVDVIPLAWGPATTAMCCAGVRGPFKRLRWRIAMLWDLTLLSLRGRGREAGSVEAYLERYATAFFVRARKSPAP